MGNITSVIRATSEMSNAVPVINGPINFRQLEDTSFTKRLPHAIAVVINNQIQEKLYSHSANSHNSFVDNCLKDRNSRVNFYPNNKLTPQENHNSTAATSSLIKPPLLPRAIGERKDSAANAVYDEKTARYNEEVNGKGNRKDEDETGRRDEKTREGEENCNVCRENDVVSLQQSNCVSTIKKHTTQQLAEGLEKSTTNLPKEPSQDNCKKKQSEMHWRRRMAETLKPCWLVLRVQKSKLEQNLRRDVCTLLQDCFIKFN